MADHAIDPAHRPGRHPPGFRQTARPSRISASKYEFMGYQNVELHVMNADGSNPRSLTASLDRSDRRRRSGRRTAAISMFDTTITPRPKVGARGPQRQSHTGRAPGLSGLHRLIAPTPVGDFYRCEQRHDRLHQRQRRATFGRFHCARRPKQTSSPTSTRRAAGKTLGEVQHLDVKSSFDQRPIDAWLVMPPNFDREKKYPLILEIHGGPFADYGPFFSTDISCMPRRATSCCTPTRVAPPPTARSSPT